MWARIYASPASMSASLLFQGTHCSRYGTTHRCWGTIACMTSKKGYLVELNPKTHVVYLKVWGLWEEADGVAYYNYYKDKVSHLIGKRWYVVADISEFPAQNEAVNAQIGKTMELSAKGGMVKAADIVNSAMTQLQIKRLSQEMRIPEFAFFKDRQAAEAWVVT
jgi:hypothetical protein